MSLVLFQYIIIPLDVAFYNFPGIPTFYQTDAFYIIRFVADVCHCCNIIVSMFTGYYDERSKNIELQQSKILL